MDVNTISTLAQQTASIGSSAYSTKTSASTKVASAASSTAATSASDAYSVEISAAAKKASTATKGLTSEQVDVLKEGIAKSQQLMIDTLTQQNLKLQGWLDAGIGSLNFGGILVGTSQFALPEVGTTPEEAAAAIGEGGAYSVDSVATRIMDMATAIAGGDSEKLQQMQAAVEKGFEQAGLTWKDAMGEDSMPQITQDTHAEITKRFNELYKQMGVTVAEGE